MEYVTVVSGNMYTIVDVNITTGQILVQFANSTSPIAIQVPVEGNRYLEGEQLDNYIKGFAPQQITPKVEIENIDSLLGLDPRTEEQKTNDLIKSIRAQRDMNLLTSDWLVLPDTGFTPEAVAKFKYYRQQLRDIPQQPGFPENVVWPIVEGEWMNHSPNIDSDENAVIELITLNNSYSGCARVLVTFETLRKRKQLSRLLYPLVQEKVIKIVTNPSGFYEKLLYAEPTEFSIYQASASFRVEDLSGDFSLMDENVLSDYMFHAIEMFPDQIGNIAELKQETKSFIASGYVKNDYDIIQGSPYIKDVVFATCPEEHKELVIKILNSLGLSSTFFNLTCVVDDNKLYVKKLDQCAYPHYTGDSQIVPLEECVEALRSVLMLTTI